MTYTFKKITDKYKWEIFLSTQPYQLFVQSWAYGEFNKDLGDDAFVLGAYDENTKLIGGSLVLRVKAKRGDFFYCPYGPILDFENLELLTEFTKELKTLAKASKVDFIRISPFTLATPQVESNLSKAKFRQAPMHMIAEYTWILDLDQDEVDLLKNMNQNHRNLIRRATKEGVAIKSSEEVLDVKKVHDLLSETASRHKFVPFSLKYMEAEFKAFQNIGKAKIYFAYHEGDLISSAIIYFYGNSAVYRHGASSSNKIKIPSSYAIQWQAIQDAKARGLKYYNFWGIAPEGNKKHPFYGITHFKKGFGGFGLALVNAKDLPVRFGYVKNWIIETLRRIKRGF
jgi:lipid II:glycine glycyltransferase (peptidoglycan interpeptide bridge formation enzyme)